MKYSEIIGLYEYFHPAYDITQESGDYWKQFIPTQNFFEVLEAFLNSLESKDTKKRKSIWLQGPYGTGKSHATGVIKHLLWDELSEIEDFIEKINKSQLRERLKNFRREHRVLPVTIKGVSGINTPKDFSLVIEKAVKDTINKLGISIRTQSEFEKYLTFIEKDDKINWQNLINNNPKLRSLTSNIETLKKRLEQKDIEIIPIIDEALGDLKISHPNIEEWLSEVLKELQNKGISHIAIYWDEFTPIMELSISSILLNVLQSIAEKSFYENIFLFIISHRHPQQTQISKEDQEKVLGRFESKRYEMENITTFHIISNAIKRKNKEIWEKLRDNLFEENRQSFTRIIRRIFDDRENLVSIIKDLFPIHPYTAQLAVGLARYVGSTERSIFSFLHDEEKGFKNFINNYPDEQNNEYFLTADKLWDYFLDELERRQEEKIHNIVSKYKLHYDSLKEKGEEYLAVFKVILLLNLLQAYVSFSDELSLLLPKEENIKDAFLGSHYYEHLGSVLAYIDKNVISKTPDGLYLISQIPLPIEEIKKEEEAVKKQYEDIIKLVERDKLKISQAIGLEKFIKSWISRETQILILWAGISEDEIRRRILSKFQTPYVIKLVIFLAKNYEELFNLKNKIKRFMNNNELAKYVIFCISEEVFGEENCNKLYEYIARRNIAEKHAYREESKRYEDYIVKLLDQWFEKIDKNYLEIIFGEKIEKLPFLEIRDKIDKIYSKEIFNYGLENIEKLTENKNIWTNKHAEKIAEIFLYSENRDELERTLGRKYPEKLLLEMLKTNTGEYILDKNLKFYEKIDLDHPVFRICKEVENALKEQEGHTFNLGEILKFLTYPPYGLYPNMVHYGVLALALRPFVNRLYESGTGRKLTPIVMKEKIKNLFNFWTEKKDRDKLEVRLGTKEEEELTEMLKDIFELKDVENLNKAKWGIRDWIKKIYLPMWSLIYLPYISEDVKEAIKAIDELNRSVDKELSEDRIKKIFELIKKVNTDLRLIMKKEKAEEGFKNWLKSYKDIRIDENEIEEVKKYLYKNMQEEVALWNEDKVYIKIKEWMIEKEEERYKMNLVRSICDLFNLQNINNFQKLREEIKNFINNELGYPLWTIKYILKIEEIHNIIEFIENFIKNDIEPSRDQVERFLKLLELRKNMLCVNLNSEIVKQGIHEWLKINHKTIDNDYVNIYLEFLKASLNKEPYNWEEKDLQDYIIYFEFQKLLAELFDINANCIKTPEGLKLKIKSQIVDKTYPFWAIGLTSDEEVNKIIEKLSNYITSDTSYSLEEIENLYKSLKVNLEKINSIWKTSEIEKLYHDWLREILGIEGDITKLVSEIKRRMNNEEYYWKKDKVENWVRKNQGSLIMLIFEEKKEKILEKIKNTDKDLREILIQLLEDYPQIVAKLDELL
jgi:hypothetical protein